MISQELLKSLFRYDIETGNFYRKKDGCRIGYLLNRGVDRPRYMYIHLRGRHAPAHKLAWLYVYGSWPKMIDHIDGNTNNNAIKNLREVTAGENQRNRSINKNNTSGVMGVYWYKKNNKWGSSIIYEGEKIYLGLHRDWFEAVCARKSAENKYGFHENHGRR